MVTDRDAAEALPAPVSVARWGRKPVRATAGATGGIRSSDWVIFGIASVAFILVAAFWFFIAGISNGDSSARTLSAFLILFSRDPHLGAVGFAWPPLPTLFRLPFLLLARPFEVVEFVGPLTSAIFAGATVAALNRLLEWGGVTRWTRATWLVATFLNPLILWHFTNGLAESGYAFLFCIVVLAAVRYGTSPTLALSVAAVAAAVAFGFRYEAVALTGALVAMVLAYASVVRVRSQAERAERLEAHLVTAIAPAALAVMLWVFFNWTIQGDPLFFLTSEFSVRGAPDVARNVGEFHPMYRAMGDPVETVKFVLLRTAQASLLLIPLVVALLASTGRAVRPPLAITILAVVASVIAIPAFQAFEGALPPWLRYWVYLPLLSLMVLAVLHRSVFPFRSRRAWAVVVRVGVIPSVILASNVVTLLAMTSPAVGTDEQLVAHYLMADEQSGAVLRGDQPDRQALREVISFLDGVEGLVLMDTQQGAQIVMAMADPGRIVVDTDRDYFDLLEDMFNRVDWVLVPDPSGQGAHDLARAPIFGAYPDVYEGLAGLELVREFEGDPDWRLFRTTARALAP